MTSMLKRALLTFSICAVIAITVLVTELHVRYPARPQFAAPSRPQHRYSTKGVYRGNPASPTWTLSREQDSYGRRLEANESSMPSGVSLSNSVHVVGTESSTEKRHGYLLVVHSSGGAQQAAGLRSYVPAQCWLGSFGLPMTLVEPFIENSIVHTLPPITKHGRNHHVAPSICMSDFFDIDHYNNVSIRNGWAEVVSWQEFIEKAPRKAIYIHTTRIEHCRCLTNEAIQEPLKVVWSQTEHEQGKCYSTDTDVGRRLRLDTLSKEHNFCIVRAIEAHPNPRLCDAKEVSDVIFGGHMPENVTLIVRQWCPGVYVPNPALPEPNKCRTACRDLTDLFLPSRKLYGHIQAYERKYSASKDHFRLAVLIRSEHVSLRNASCLNVCLSKVTQIVHSLKAGPQERPFVTVDVGRYGSSVMFHHHDEMVSLAKDTAMNLLDNSQTFEEWENSFIETAGTEDRGYIAALQQSIASRAECLVIVGGGSFPRLALLRYLSQHPDPSSWCFYLVCLNSKYKYEYDDAITSQNQRNNVHTQWVPIAEDSHVGKLYFTNAG